MYTADLSDPGTEENDWEIRFVPRGQSVEEILPIPARAQATTDCEILNMVNTLNGAIAAVSQDTAKIQRAYDQLRTENIARDRALTDLSEIVREYGLSPSRMRPQPALRTPLTVRPPVSETAEVTPAVDTHIRRPPPEIRQGYRPAAPIQRFNNKTLNWPAWFRHFRAVADVHGWSKDQRALQLVSYLDETAMNVAQELGDADLYNYDVLVKLLSVGI